MIEPILYVDGDGKHTPIVLTALIPFEGTNTHKTAKISWQTILKTGFIGAIKSVRLFNGTTTNLAIKRFGSDLHEINVPEYHSVCLPFFRRHDIEVYYYDLVSPAPLVIDFYADLVPPYVINHGAP